MAGTRHARVACRAEAAGSRRARAPPPPPSRAICAPSSLDAVSTTTTCASGAWRSRRPQQRGQHTRRLVQDHDDREPGHRSGPCGTRVARIGRPGASGGLAAPVTLTRAARPDRHRRPRRRAPGARRRRALGARALRAAAARCGPAPTACCARRRALVHRAGHAWEQTALPLRAARAGARAAVPGQRRAAGVRAHRGRDPRRRRAAPSRLVLAAPTPPGSGGCCRRWPVVRCTS